MSGLCNTVGHENTNTIYYSFTSSSALLNGTKITELENNGSGKLSKAKVEYEQNRTWITMQ